MRVLLLAPLAAAALLVGACTGGSGDTTLRRSQDIESNESTPKKPKDGSKGGSSDSPTPSSSTSDTSDPAPAPAPATPDAGGATPTTPPATPAQPGTCGAPKCFGLGGFGGCKATDGAGDSVVLACNDQGCACLTANKTTSVFDGDVTSGEDAAQLFLANCACQ